MQIKTILWPTDLSSASRAAAPHVVHMAEKHGAKVVLMYVAVDLCAYFPAYGNYPSQHTVNEFQTWELKQAREKMEAVCAGELKGCPMLDIKLVRGEWAEEILKAIAAEKADLVVMTKDGRELTPGFRGAAQRVLVESTVPVQFV